MSSRRLSFLLSCVLTLASGTATAITPPPELAAIRAMAEGMDDPYDPVFQQALLALHADLGIDSNATDSLRERPTALLQELADASHLVAFYVDDSAPILAYEALLTELRRRQADSPSQWSELVRLMVKLRMWPEAKEVASAMAVTDVELPHIRDEVGDQGRSRWHLSADGRTLIRESVPESSTLQVLAVVHPMCSPSLRAMTHILADPEARQLLGTTPLWMMPANGYLHLDRLRAWQQQHPPMQLAFVHRQSEWPQVTDWATPSFHILRDDQLLGSFSGWPKDDPTTAERFRRFLADHGLADDGAAEALDQSPRM